MAKKEIRTDLWVYDLLKQAKIHFDAQGSNIKEIDKALKTASKKGTGNVGFPEYVAVVKDYLLVIEDKADLSRHIKLNEMNCISHEVNAVCDYAVNGALFYAKHLAKNTTYKKIFAFGKTSTATLINTLQITYLTAVKRILKILKDGYLKKGKTLRLLYITLSTRVRTCFTTLISMLKEWTKKAPHYSLAAMWCRSILCVHGE